jgi:hypothetical protein
MTKDRRDLLIAVTLGIVLGVAVLLAAGCAKRVARVLPHPSPAAPITDMTLVPWCHDKGGTSFVYPCKWDSLVSPVPSWGRDVLPIALYVRRDLGCPLPLPEKVTCYWAPQDR